MLWLCILSLFQCPVDPRMFHPLTQLLPEVQLACVILRKKSPFWQILSITRPGNISLWKSYPTIANQKNQGFEQRFESLWAWEGLYARVRDECREGDRSLGRVSGRQVGRSLGGSWQESQGDERALRQGLLCTVGVWVSARATPCVKWWDLKGSMSLWLWHLLAMSLGPVM